MQVVVDDLLTNYTVMGEGHLVLFLHGWGDSSSTFHDLQNILSKKFKIISLDLPGFGASQMPPKAWDLDDYANFVKQFLLKLDLSMPEVLIGHSNGGALAIRALATKALGADKLILLASAGVRTGRPLKKLVVKGVAKTGKALTFWAPESAKQRLRKKLYGVAGSDMLVAPHMQETFKLTVKQDIQSDARKLVLPTLLIYGENDRAVPVADGRKLAELITSSQLIVLPGVDHFVHQTALTDVSKHVQEFLE